MFVRRMIEVLVNRIQFVHKYLAKRRQFLSRNGVFFIHRQECKNAWAFEVRREIDWLGDDMDVDVVKSLALSETHEVFFLDRSNQYASLEPACTRSRLIPGIPLW